MSKGKSGRHSLIFLAVVAIDLAAMAWFWHSLVRFRRPLDILLILVIVLGSVTMLASGKLIQNALLVLVSIAFCLLAVEMSQKYFDILSLGSKHSIVHGRTGPYAWTSDDPASYLSARQRAVDAGDLDLAMLGRHAGDIFSRLDLKANFRNTDASGTRVTHVDALKTPWLDSTPNGYLMAESNVIRHYLQLSDRGDMLFDGVYTINSHGFRHTAGPENGDGAVIFLGCSQTFGFGLNDDETAAHHCAEASAFSKTVLNISMINTGPHQALRELETQYHFRKTGVTPDKVQAVVYTLIDDHPNRVVSSSQPGAPYYRLEDGNAVYRGTFAESENYGKLGVLYGRSRVLPILWERLGRRQNAQSYRWRLTHAILRRMNEICRRDYGVGLTVMYWDETPEVVAQLEADSIRVLRLSDAWGRDWRDYAIRYMLHDGHANAYGNQLIGTMVHNALMQNRIETASLAGK